MVITAEERARLDSYSRIAESIDLLQKIEDLQQVIKAAKTGMLVTRDSNDNLHSRAMTPANVSSDSQLRLVFLANNVSSKCEEIENDSHVNVSFFDPLSSDWVSYSGRARVTRDKELIHMYCSTLVTSYIGDLGDGVHEGDEGDPRVVVVEIVPDEIKYWVSNQIRISRTVQVAASAVIRKSTAPGELRTIRKEEIQLVQSAWD